ncbi:MULTISPECIES: endonuclease/exonuclease/phosphatase family protein [unclassified Streptomyces]|uniref:endonuclease/exonuclease/phosphatase family protein n=1 Tax=unclassified Streptomyces TaxID=2593676 RepID=UPI0001C1895A|nr:MULTISPECIES: endonuclease/exonuclease/phosphatase family protein [unclassified Streptomyces]MYR66523.1 endonuclease/exonuclease/phosphatase family protein [Streptomyces sp. SID4939]MYS04583.1 endonuclease/exonuclease/phosphatase family protein [Streptomyces sp. SID4940]MYT61841.1 endonuclease/exonuclease/phosphatase family protein [Streptomyces sp. SID8357]MYT85211.1 endonuclease/exonuclease/phosphatase family protein [Streptomyces sp. SID8360]MYW39094.1 endonuclease/exonuclease/phosphatas
MNGASRWGWARGRVLASVAVLVALLLVFHAVVPDTPAHLGSLLETFLPWLGLAVPVLLVLALLRRSYGALAAPLLPAVAWAALFGGLLLPGGAPGDGDLTAVQHNVSDVNPDPSGTARALRDTGAGLVAVEELMPAALPAFQAVLGADYPYRATQGTVGLWSTYPLSDVRKVDIKPEAIGYGWDRGMRATARTPQGEVAVYVAHLPSVRLGLGGFRAQWRNESAVLLGEALAAEPLDRVVLLGDLNSTLDDRGLDPVTSRLTRPDTDLAFSWPAGLPLARIDQILTRSAKVTHLWSLPATGSDHLPVAARIKL